jgi:RimJ/RimL family protein N-acetyltransferase
MRSYDMLSSDAVRLRPPEERDLNFFVALRNDLEIQLHLMTLPKANPAAKVRAWLTARCEDPQGVFFAIAERESDQAAGFIQLTHLDTLHGTAELGIAVGSNFAGRGLAAQALQLLEKYVRAVFALRKITLKVLADNSRAVVFYERAGYRRVGVLAQHHYQQDAHHDVLIMEKLLVESPQA